MPVRAAAPPDRELRRRAGRDRRRHARPPDGVRLASAARARQPARRPGRRVARRGRAGRRGLLGDGAELPRRHARGGLQQRDLDGHLHRQPRRADRGDRRADGARARRRSARPDARWNERRGPGRCSAPTGSERCSSCAHRPNRPACRRSCAGGRRNIVTWRRARDIAGVVPVDAATQAACRV